MLIRVLALTGTSASSRLDTGIVEPPPVEYCPTRKIADGCIDTMNESHSHLGPKKPEGGTVIPSIGSSGQPELQ